MRLPKVTITITTPSCQKITPSSPVARTELTERRCTCPAPLLPSPPPLFPEPSPPAIRPPSRDRSHVSRRRECLCLLTPPQIKARPAAGGERTRGGGWRRRKGRTRGDVRRRGPRCSLRLLQREDLTAPGVRAGREMKATPFRALSSILRSRELRCSAQGVSALLQLRGIKRSCFRFPSARAERVDSA